MDKKISEMSNRGILRQQLELLAEDSKKACSDEDLCYLSNSMNSIYKSLISPLRIAIFSVLTLHFSVCFIIFIKNLFRRKS